MAILPFTGPVPDIIPQLNNLFGGVLVSVKNYGARGDGVTDDTAAIQAVLDLFNYSSGHKSGIIVFPAGTYLVTGLTYQGDFGHAIWIWCPPPGQSQNGDGAVLKYNGTSGGTVLSLLGANNCIVENLSISGNAGLAKIGLLIDYDSSRSMSSFNCEVRHPQIGQIAGVDSAAIVLGTSNFASAEHKVINPWITGHSTPGTTYYGILNSGSANAKNYTIERGQINGFKWGVKLGNSGYHNLNNVSFSSNTDGDINVISGNDQMSITGGGSEGSGRFIDGTGVSHTVAGSIGVQDAYWHGACPIDDYVIIFSGQLRLTNCDLGNSRTASSFPKIKNAEQTEPGGSAFLSLMNTYQGVTDGKIPLYDTSDNRVPDASATLWPYVFLSFGDKAVPLGGGSPTAQFPPLLGRSNFGIVKTVDSSTSPYDVRGTDRVILIDATSGNVTVNLDAPHARNRHREYLIKRIDSSANVATVAAPSAVLDSVSSVTLSQNQTLHVISDAVQWRIQSRIGMSKIRSTADGLIALFNNAESGFTRLNFGGETSGFPALKRNAAALETRLADDSAYADLAAQNFLANAVYKVGGTQVVGARDTGWTAGTGTANKGTFATYAGQDVSAAYVEAEAQATDDAVKANSQRIKAIEDALRAHGLIN